MAESELDTEKQVQTIWHLGGLTYSQLGRRVWKEIDHDNVLTLGSALAYNFLLASFPLLLFLVSLLGMFAARGTQMRDLLFTALAQFVPPSASDLITKTLNEITRGSGGGKMTLGIELGLISASGGTSSMITGLYAAYDIRDSRPWWRVRGIALALTIALTILVTLALVIVLFGGQAADHFKNT